MADRYDSMTTAEMQAEADSRTPAVDLSGATTNAQRAELLRAVPAGDLKNGNVTIATTPGRVLLLLSPR